MPPAPEGAEACSAVGVIEVFRQPNPKQKTETDSHVAVAGEIEIELKAVADCARPDAERVKAALGIHRVCQLRCRSGKQQFFRQSADEAADAVERAVPAGGARIKGFSNIGEFHERPGDELREKREILQQLAEAARAVFGAAVDVDNVADCLKGVERNAERQRAEGFIRGQHRKVDRDAGGQHGFPSFFRVSRKTLEK